MKKFERKEIITMLVLLTILIVVSIIFYFLELKSVVYFDFSNSITLVSFIYLLIGWIIPNNIEYKYRKANAYYKGALPDDINKKRYEIRIPFMLIGAIGLVLSVILYYVI